VDLAYAEQNLAAIRGRLGRHALAMIRNINAVPGESNGRQPCEVPPLGRTVRV
jgi:hypothetical protein